MTVRTYPTVPEVLPLVERYYQDNPVGGSLHIVLDDGNYDNASVDFCIQWAIAQDDMPGWALGLLLRHMTKSQRARVAKRNTG